MRGFRRTIGLILVAGSSAVLPCHARQAADSPQLPPVGLGSLRQEDIAVRVDAGGIQIRVLPLNELIIRLMAPDSYAALHALREAKAKALVDVRGRYGTEPEIFLVTIFATVEQAQFDPEQLTLISRNRFFRPISILPNSPQWNEHRLTQRETASAVYAFESGIALLEPFTVDYGGLRSDQWAQTLRRVERERARIEARIRRRDLTRSLGNAEASQQGPRQPRTDTGGAPRHDVCRIREVFDAGVQGSPKR